MATLAIYRGEGMRQRELARDLPWGLSGGSLFAYDVLQSWLNENPDKADTGNYVLISSDDRDDELTVLYIQVTKVGDRYKVIW